MTSRADPFATLRAMTATLTLPAWERRYRAPSVCLPDSSPEAPHRIVLDFLAAQLPGIAT